MPIIVLDGCIFLYLHGHTTCVCIEAVGDHVGADHSCEICLESSDLQKTTNRIEKSD